MITGAILHKPHMSEYAKFRDLLLTTSALKRQAIVRSEVYKSLINAPLRTQSLRNCKCCSEAGYHSTYYDYPWLKICPIHEEPLTDRCPDCKRRWPSRCDLWQNKCPTCGIHIDLPTLFDRAAPFSSFDYEQLRVIDEIVRLRETQPFSMLAVYRKVLLRFPADPVNNLALPSATCHWDPDIKPRLTTLGIPTFDVSVVEGELTPVQEWEWRSIRGSRKEDLRYEVRSEVLKTILSCIRLHATSFERSRIFRAILGQLFRVDLTEADWQDGVDQNFGQPWVQKNLVGASLNAAHIVCLATFDDEFTVSRSFYRALLRVDLLSRFCYHLASCLMDSAGEAFDQAGREMLDQLIAARASVGLFIHDENRLSLVYPLILDRIESAVPFSSDRSENERTASTSEASKLPLEHRRLTQICYMDSDLVGFKF